MIPCARTRIRQRIHIRRRLVWSDHVAIYAVPYGGRMGMSFIRVTAGAFSRHSFLPLENHVWSSLAVDQQNHGGRNRAAHSTGPRKCCSLRPKLWWLERFVFPKTDVQQWFRLNWCHEWCREKGRGKYTALCLHEYNQKRSQVRGPLRVSHVHTQSFCRTP